MEKTKGIRTIFENDEGYIQIDKYNCIVFAPLYPNHKIYLNKDEVKVIVNALNQWLGD